MSRESKGNIFVQDVDSKIGSYLDVTGIGAIAATNRTYSQQSQELLNTWKKSLKDAITTELQNALSHNKQELMINDSLATQINHYPNLVNDVIKEHNSIFLLVGTIKARNLGLQHFPDISSFPRVHTVDCANNNLTSLTTPETVYNINCTGNPNLQRLDIPGYNPQFNAFGHELKCDPNQEGLLPSDVQQVRKQHQIQRDQFLRRSQQTAAVSLGIDNLDNTPHWER